MEFLTVSTEKRPIRLNKSTRKWAYESQRGKYGDEILKTPFVSLDDIEGFEELSSVQKYDVAIRAIAKNAPIRICPEEKICASATLGDALGHIVPAKYNSEKLFMSVSHITVRFDKVINEGLDCYSKEIEERLKDTDISASQTEFLKSLQNVIESIRIWHVKARATWSFG